MGSFIESCSECGESFELMFQHQIEERSGAFAFYCSTECREHDQLNITSSVAMVTCDACHKHLSINLAAAALFSIEGQRHYACSTECRRQLVAEGYGARLGAMSLVPPPRRRVGERRRRRITVLAPRSERSVKLAAPQVRAPRHIAVFNHQRGMGKTTTAVSLAAGLAARGLRTLLVDMDAQGDVAVSLGVTAEPSLYQVLIMDLPIRSALQKARPRLDVLLSNRRQDAEPYLAGYSRPDEVLAERLAEISGDYDYIIFDCAPRLSLMAQNALMVADSLLVPVACDTLSLGGVRQVLRTVRTLNKVRREPLQLWGVLPTFCDGRDKSSEQALDALRDHFGSRCLAPIRANITIDRAQGCARTIFEHAPAAPGSADYKALVNQVLRAELRDSSSRHRAAG